MPITWPRAQVLQACIDYGPLVTPIPGIESSQLLAALAESESTLGLDCGPRLEPAWDIGGVYAENPQQAALLEQYGQSAAKSYGPLQVMFYNAPGYTPNELNTDLSIAMRAAIGYLNKQIRHFQPTSVAEVGMLWNSGHVTRLPNVPIPGVQIYCKDLTTNYAAAENWIGILTP